MADNSASGSLTAQWDGVTPTTAPAGSIVLLAPGRDATIGIDVRGTFVATITLETSVDGLNWSAPTVTTIAGAASTATFSAPGSRLVAVSGAALLRARCSAYTSGTATVTMAGTPGGGGGASGGGGGAMTIADGADVAEGTTTDAGIITDVSGTVIGFLRGAILRWNTFLGRFPATLGGTTAANSLPVTLSTDGQFVTSTGSLTEAVPATDTASSGLNGRLQRIAQRLTSLIGQLPAALVGGRLDVNVGATGVTQPVSGTITANAGTGTFAISAASLPLPSTAATDRATAAAPASVELSDGAAFYTAAKTGQLPTALVSARLDVNLGAAPALVTVQGDAAVGAVPAGNPLLLGGVDPAGGTTMNNLQVTAAATPNLRVQLYNGSTSLGSGFADGSTISSGNFSISANMGFNGTNFDRMRNNIDVTLLGVASRTTTQTSADIVVYNAHSLIVTLDATTIGTGSLTLTINYKDPASSKYILLLSGAAVTTNSTNVYTINPNIPAVANVTAQKDIGRILQVVVTANNANAVIYSVGYTLVS